MIFELILGIAILSLLGYLQYRIFDYISLKGISDLTRALENLDDNLSKIKENK